MKHGERMALISSDLEYDRRIVHGLRQPRLDVMERDCACPSGRRWPRSMLLLARKGGTSPVKTISAGVPCEVAVVRQGRTGRKEAIWTAISLCSMSGEMVDVSKGRHASLLAASLSTRAYQQSDSTRLATTLRSITTNLKHPSFSRTINVRRLDYSAGDPGADIDWRGVPLNT